MWMWILLAVISLAVCTGLISSARASGLTKRRRRQAMEAFFDAPVELRAQTMRAALDTHRGNATAWYLLGCAQLADCRTTDAARAFGMAHHLDCRLMTAALFTFACLKARDGGGSDIIDQCVDTWEEMKRPDLLRGAADRWMFQRLAAGEEPPAGASSLGKLIWLAVGPEHRMKLHTTLASTDPRWAPLRQE